MCEPFIRNHQYNFIKKEANTLQNALRTVADPKVQESVRLGVEMNIAGLFPQATDDQRQLVTNFTKWEKTEEIQLYLRDLIPYMTEFPDISQKQIQKLFPKNKKLTDLAALESFLDSVIE